MTAETMMLVGGLSAFVLTLHWVRARELREKFAVYWLILAVLLLLVGIFPQSIMWFADAARLSYATAVLFAALTVIYLFAFAVSVSLSTHHRRNVRLTQQVALLEERLRKLEAKGDSAPEQP
jgi:drug/metabolite transporter (DMT)-like permease